MVWCHLHSNLGVALDRVHPCRHWYLPYSWNHWQLHCGKVKTSKGFKWAMKDMSFFYTWMTFFWLQNAQLWERVVTLLNDLFELQLTKIPALCILGLLPENNTLTGRQRLWIRLAATTGCRIILKHWKSSTPSCFKEWTEQMTRMATYEWVTYRVMGREDIFDQVWGSILMSVEGSSVWI